MLGACSSFFLSPLYFCFFFFFFFSMQGLEQQQAVGARASGDHGSASAHLLVRVPKTPSQHCPCTGGAGTPLLCAYSTVRSQYCVLTVLYCVRTVL